MLGKSTNLTKKLLDSGIKFDIQLQLAGMTQDDDQLPVSVAIITLFGDVPEEHIGKMGPPVINKVQVAGTGKTVEEAEDNALKRGLLLLGL